MATLRHVLNAAILGVLTLFWSVVALVCLPFTYRRGVSYIARLWGKTVLPLVGVQVEIEGADQVFDAPAYLVMANHTSHFDVLCLYANLPVETRPVAKRELAYIPIFGWLLRAGAAIMIDRGNREKAVASIERAGRTIRRGRSVLLFPEGTRTPPGEVGPLKKGPFHLALEAQVPILPVGVIGTGEVLLPGDWRIRPGRVTVRVGRPIPTAGLVDEGPDRERLMEEVAAALRSLTTTHRP